MPYGGTSPEQDRRIERCVADVMQKGVKPRDPKQDKKSAAIAICKAKILKNEDINVLMNKYFITEGDEMENLILESSLFEAKIDEEKREVLAGVLRKNVLSANSRFYPARIVEAIASKLAGLKSYADHLVSRSVKDLIAT